MNIAFIFSPGFALVDHPFGVNPFQKSENRYSEKVAPVQGRLAHHAQIDGFDDIGPSFA